MKNVFNLVVQMQLPIEFLVMLCKFKLNVKFVKYLVNTKVPLSEQLL